MEGRGERLYAIDWLRGIVMVLMALDHVRDYFGDFRADPLDLATTTPAFFMTRWITHFCAPVFVFLAGTAAWLYGSRGRTKAELSRFLWTRGLWLVVLEFTVIYFAWTNTFLLGMWFLQVIAAIGVAMIAMAALVRLPMSAICGIGLVLVLGHNLLDPLTPESFGAGGWIWSLLHEGNMADGSVVTVIDGRLYLLVVYPLLPWIGVMALGYALGPLAARPREERRRTFLGLGFALTAAFLVLRATNLYGDPTPWSSQGSGVMTALSFLNCQKYPPSLCYLLMTLGPSIGALALLDREPGALGRRLVVFGRVPLFYYVAHMYAIHLSARVFHKLAYGEAFSPFGDGFRLLFTGQALPTWYGQPLWVVYTAWILIVVALYPPCAWFAGVKRRGRSPLLSYL